MLTATVDRACLPAMPQQLHVRYAIILITDGISRQIERESQSGRTRTRFRQAPEQERTKCFPTVLEIGQTKLQLQPAETRCLWDVLLPTGV